MRGCVCLVELISSLNAAFPLQILVLYTANNHIFLTKKLIICILFIVIHEIARSLSFCKVSSHSVDVTQLIVYGLLLVEKLSGYHSSLGNTIYPTARLHCSNSPVERRRTREANIPLFHRICWSNWALT